MSLRERIGQVSSTSNETNYFEVYGIEGNPFPSAGQPSGHPRMEDEIDLEFAKRVSKFELGDRPSQILLVEGTQGVGKTNLLNYYEREFRDFYQGDEAFYIIRYYPDSEPSFDSVVRRIFQNLDHVHFERIGKALVELQMEKRDSIKDVARNHEVRIVLNTLERFGRDPDKLSECARLALEWFVGLRILKKHREVLGVDYRLDTVESRTQALRDVIYVSKHLGLLKGILLLLDELEKQDYSLSKTPVLRFLSAIRALIDALPQNLFLVLAMTRQAKQRYFAMMPAFASRLQDILEMNPIMEFNQAKELCDFYIQKARDSVQANSGGRMKGEYSTVFSDEELQEFYDDMYEQSDKKGTEGITPEIFCMGFMSSGIIKKDH